MVLPTPFERLLQDVSQQASKDPLTAFSRLEELYGKTLDDQDVVQLGALAVHLGGTSLGRWDETERFQRRLLTHPAVVKDGPTARSLWRGLAVVLRCCGKRSEAEQAIAAGVTSTGERCRLAIMTAQTLAARGRAAEAVPFLQEAGALMHDLPQSDDIVGQGATIASNLARLGENQLRQAQDLLLAATGTARDACSRHGDWRVRHKSLYHHARAWLLAANPARALGVVQEMMALEDENDSGPAERFHTASLACRAQLIRGQFKVAGAAFEACQDFAGRVEETQAKFVRAALEDLERFRGSMLLA